MSETRKYTCAVCHITYDAEWSDEEAIEELRDKFGAVNVENCELVCDDCFKAFDPDTPGPAVSFVAGKGGQA